MKEVLIAGGGLAAVTAANKLAGTCKVTMIIKGARTEGNSWKAQGGIACTFLPEDSAISHIEDTLKAGCFLNDYDTVAMLVNKGKIHIKNMVSDLTIFDRETSGKLQLGREGAHSFSRIIHAGGDQTGKKLMASLYKKIDPAVSIREHVMVQDLLVEDNKCRGVILRDSFNRLSFQMADAVIIASGGIGGMFEATSNDRSSTGDGLAIASRAGVKLKHLEYIQFHPTLLQTAEKNAPLISEAVRGAGAVLVLENGRRIMEDTPGRDLAPRDVVARKVSHYTQAEIPVYLDISQVDNFPVRFPQITALCAEAGIAVAGGKLPVTCGAHFHMGGIETNREGQTSLPQLYAIGEAACTGVHGANRLASNSLLEAIVFANQAALSIQNMNVSKAVGNIVKSIPFSVSSRAEDPALPSKQEIRRKVSQALGILRNEKDLKQLIAWSGACLSSTAVLSSKSEEEKRNMLTAANTIAAAALANKQSTGAHFRTDKLPREETNERIAPEKTADHLF